MYENEHKKIELLKEGIARIEAKCQEEGRQPLEIERNLINDMRAEADHIEKSLPERAMTVPQNGLIGAAGYGGGYEHKAPGNGRDYQSMFNLARGSLDNGGFKNAGEFLRVLDSGRFDPRLDVQASMGETTPSSGGFLAPTQFAGEWLDGSLPTEIVRNLCRVYPMISETLEVAGWDGADMSAGATHGGLTMEFLGESAEATAQTPKVRKIELHARMAAIYVNSSIELVQDGRGFETNLQSALQASLGYGIDRYALTGSGAGCPQGVLSAPCKIQVTKATGQSADSLVYANLKAMFARQLNPQKAVWLFNATSIPELLEQSVAVGVGGDFVPLLNEKDGKFHIFGRPVYFHPAMPTLGDENDCAFVDFNFFAIGLRKEVWIDQSDAPRWDYRERSYRILMRWDSQCTLDSAITPENGDSLSPVVTLGERA